METSIIRIVAQVAGIGGIALGILLILFREVIRKNIFPDLTKNQGYQLLKLIIFLVWGIAVLGLVAWTFLTAREQDVQFQSQQDFPTATSSAIIAPPNSTELPKVEFQGLSVTLDPVFFWLSGGLSTNIESNQTIQTVSRDNIIFGDEVSPQILFSKANSFGTFHLILIGKSDNEPVIVTNRIPIKILSYDPIEEVNFLGYCTGGGDDVWIMEANISETSINNPEQIVWASYINDLKQEVKEFTDALGVSPEDFDIPSELIKVLNGEEKNLPDFFSIAKNEPVIISVNTIFNTPGIYKIQFGVEYIYNGSKGIIWVQEPIVVNVFGTYNLWGCLSGNEIEKVELQYVCNPVLENNSYEYQCVKP